jgi:glycosyltransferase involved in cell wall biosynthesis
LENAMRVTHVITRLIVGGAQENTIASVLGLRQKPGLEVDLVSGPTTGPEGSLESAFTDAPQLLTIVPELVRPVHPWKDALALRQLARLFRQRRPDLVHTHSGKAGILGRIAAARARVPIIVHHIHGPSFGPFQGPLANLVFRGAERCAARVTTHFICSAHAMTRRYLTAGIGKPKMFTRIFSGFDLRPYARINNDAALRAQLGLPSDAFVIGKIARLAPLKGHDDLFAALKLLLSQCPNARLLLVGDGSLREPFKAKLSTMGLADKVVFTGLLPPHDVPRHIGIMDCLAHLSTREALSRALPQALAAGRPVLAYDFDGADEICLEGETGFLIRTGEVEVVADRLLRLFSDHGLRERFGKRGREFVFENFSVQRLVDSQHELYLRLAAQHLVPTTQN